MQTLGDYQLLKRLGAGGMGEVFLARLGSDGFGWKHFALKKLLPHLNGEQGFLDALLEEVRITALLHHPNIVQVHELGRDGETWFFALELVDGADLSSFTEAMPPGCAAFVIRELALGLHHAHTARNPQGLPLKVLHRDVSPHNVLLGRGGQVKLSDFGIAQAAKKLATRSEDGSLAGKLEWMSPEHFEGAELDAKSDQFSLGVVAWELLTGSRLFEGDGPVEVMEQVLECRVEPPSRLNDAVPEGFDAVLAQMLAKSPTLRFVDCEAVARALEPFSSTRDEFARWMDPRLPPSLIRVATASLAKIATHADSPLSPAEQEAVARLRRLGKQFTLEDAEAAIDDALDVLEALRVAGVLERRDLSDGTVAFALVKR